ncbi:hypothetical protein JRQ81_002838 [Phrynocephalus forsythii]|uniref:Taste receptor type 2 n=1 Tax=Phrynocephalus forsythii TaxID=171643 RepID=A0A9Q0XJE1_9SAUR|nr:hypothetical protein JRQ81_002838 [Phrynocephalus forsythii]
MTSLQIIVFIIATAFLVLGGLVSNGFIATLIITEWSKCRRLNSSELLLLSLGVSNVFITVFLPGYFAVHIFSIVTIRHLVGHMLMGGTLFAGLCRYTFTAWLCVFYCVKILNSTQSFFLWWKLRISWLIPRLIVGTVIFSLLVSLALLNLLPDYHPGHIASSVTNVTHEEMLELNSLYFLSFVAFTGCPLVVVLLSSILVVASLCSHVCQMTSNESCLKNPQTQAHTKAAGTVVSLLFLYVSFYVGNILIHPEVLTETVRIFAALMMMVYSPAQAAILVFVNPKLKQAASRMLLKKKH